MKPLAISVLVSYLGFCSQASGQGGIITTVAGNGTSGFSGDGGPATSAGLSFGFGGVAVDASGNLFIPDTGHGRVRKVSTSGIITTVAGNGTFGFSGDGGPATSAELLEPVCVAVDASGNLFIADFQGARIRKVSASGIITTVAGNGTQGFSGDGGPAISASFAPSSVAVDASGNLFIADEKDNVIRKVSAATGIITTVAGNGTEGFSGDGGPATSAELAAPFDVAVDASGSLFIADDLNERIREVSASGIITTVAGSGCTISISTLNCGSFSGDGGPATSALLNRPEGVAVDASGNLFIADSFNALIRKVSASGIITTVAGHYPSLTAFSGDGGLATSASLNDPGGVAVDAAGDLFIADTGNHRIREVFAQTPSLTVSPANISLSLVEGASSSQQISLTSPAEGLAYSASTSASWITLTPSSGTAPGTITVAINTASLQPGAYTSSITISNPGASPAQETVSVSLTVTAATATISFAPTALNFQIQQGALPQSQSLQIGGTAGTTWKATAATSTGGTWLSVSPASGQIPGSLTAMASWNGLLPGTYLGSVTIQAPANPASSTIRATMTVTAGNNIITTVAGNGTNGFSGDGGPATSAALQFLGSADPAGLAVDASGNIFIADFANDRVRKVSPNGIITTVAGGGTGGDGGPATAASLGLTPGVAVDTSGNIFISTETRIRKVTASGIITTVAGGGTGGGDGGPATAASLGFATGVAVDASGNIFIADSDNQRIRKVSASGVITTVAGNGVYGFSGDGGPATSASLALDGSGVAVDTSGDIFIADTDNGRIRKVSASSGIITTVAASLAVPYGVAVDASGNIFVADRDAGRIWEVSASGTVTTFAGGGTGGDGGPATSASAGYPLGVAVDASGNVFFTEQGNGIPPNGSGPFGPSEVRKVTVSASVPLPAPSITSGGIVAVDSTVATIQAGEFVSIYGTNLGPAPPATWTGVFVTSLGGTSVTIDGNAAYLTYASPTQINLQAPNNTNTTTRSVPVVVTTRAGTTTSTVTLAQFAPSFLLFDSKHVTGIILRPDGSGSQGGGAYDLLGPTGNSLGFPTVAAKAGDSVELYAAGFGPTNPPIQAGQAFSGAAPTTNQVNLLIKNMNVIPSFAGFSSSLLYQINLVVPAGLGTGDVPLVATVGGAQTQSGVVISLQ